MKKRMYSYFDLFYQSDFLLWVWIICCVVMAVFAAFFSCLKEGRFR